MWWHVMWVCLIECMSLHYISFLHCLGSLAGIILSPKTARFRWTVFSPDSGSYRGSYFQWRGRATNHFGWLDVAPGCHCRVQRTWCQCSVPLHIAIVVWVEGGVDDQLWGSGRGAIAGCHCSVLSSEDQHPPNCCQKLHLWHSLGISSHVKPIAVSNSKLRKASNILLGIFDPNIFQTWGSCSQRPWETDCSRFLHVPIGHLLQVEKKHATIGYTLRIQA